MKLTILSDLFQGHHRSGGRCGYWDLLGAMPLEALSGDILILAGDVLPGGAPDRLGEFRQWLAAVNRDRILNYRHVIVVAGNHDHCLQNLRDDDLLAGLAGDMSLTRLHYLVDRAVEILAPGGDFALKVYGSPWTTGDFGYCQSMAFACREAEIAEKWRLIPADTDILITHMPPYGILDNGFGCRYLLKRVQEIGPRLHAFGHVHECPGWHDTPATLFVNGSCQWHDGIRIAPVVVVDFDGCRFRPAPPVSSKKGEGHVAP